MTKKRKIKVLAASNGSKVDNPLQELGQGLIQGADLLVNPFITSDASTSKEALGQSLTNVGKGAAIGLQIAGPIGAAGGALVGAIGSKGREADMTSFTDYDEGTLGTGLIGTFTNRRLRRQRERIKRNAYSNREAVRGTEYLANNFEMQYGDMDSNTFASGGTTNSLAYVDDGELISTPTGIKEVPEEGKPTDSNLVSLPTGSRILSDKLKVPGSNETFAERGKKIMKRKKSLYKDQLAQNSAELNSMNEQAAFNSLFEQQETLKKKRGIKPKSKGLPAYVDGGPEETYTVNGITRNIAPLSKKVQRRQDGTIVFTADPYDNVGVGDSVRINDTWYRLQNRRTIGGSKHAQYLLEQLNPVTKTIDKQLDEIIVTPTSTPTIDKQLDEIVVTAPRTPRTRTKSNTTIPTPPTVEQVWLQDMPELTKAGINVKSSNAPTPSKVRRITPEWEREDKPDEYTTPDPLKHRTNWLALAPVLSNLFTSTPEKVDAVYNPYANSIMRAMGGRRYDIRPVINDINRNRAMANYNASQVNTNTGANMAYMLASQANANNAISAARAAESNANNSYLADYANIANNLGQQWVNATNLAADANARNRATARNIRRAGLSQLSQWGQADILARNQLQRDNAYLQLYDPMLRDAFTSEAYNNFYNFLSRR